MDARAPLAPSLAREGGLICECTTQCQLALRVHFAHGRVLIWRHCLLHGHVKTPFLHGALRKALRMGPPAAGAVLAFQLAWTTAVLLLAAGSSFEAEQAGPRCKACGLHVLDWRRSAACTAARIRLAHCAVLQNEATRSFSWPFLCRRNCCQDILRGAP